MENLFFLGHAISLKLSEMLGISNGLDMCLATVRVLGSYIPQNRSHNGMVFTTVYKGKMENL